MKVFKQTRLMKVFALYIFIVFICGCQNFSECNSQKTSDVSSEHTAEIVDLQEFFLQKMPNAEIKESIYADVDGDGAEDFIALFKLNGKASNVGVAFSNKTWAAVDVAAGKNDDMAFNISNSLFVENNSVAFILMKSNDFSDLYEFKVKFSYLGNGYDVAISSKRLKEDS